MLEMHPRERLRSLKLTPDIEKSTNRILDECPNGGENIPETIDKVYAIGKGVAIKSGIVQKQANYRRKKILKWKQEREEVER